MNKQCYRLVGIALLQMALSVVAGVLLFFFLTLALYIGGNCLRWRFRKRKQLSEDSMRKTRDRLLNPKWGELEDHYGRPIPQPIKNLYIQTELLIQTNIAFRDRNGGEWHIAEFEPADLQALKWIWPDLTRSKNFPFASDSVGDLYYVPLEASAPETCPVMYYHHDGGDVELVTNSLDEFLSWRQMA